MSQFHAPSITANRLTGSIRPRCCFDDLLLVHEARIPSPHGYLARRQHCLKHHLRISRSGYPRAHEWHCRSQILAVVLPPRGHRLHPHRLHRFLGSPQLARQHRDLLLQRRGVPNGPVQNEGLGWRTHRGR